MKYGGSTFDPALDEQRLNEQTIRVYRLMIDEEWRTLSEISAVTEDPEASISARLRDLRKPDFGGFDVQRRRRSAGLWEYRLQPPTDPEPTHAKKVRNPFLAGMMYAAKVVLKAGDYSAAKRELAVELKKATRRAA